MRVFLDTEFTGLTSDPRLLSIGFVADDGNELYVELADGWSDANCSKWVREHVIPMLGKGERLTRRQTGKRILDWLSSFETMPTLLGDTDWDTSLIAELMHECGITHDSYRLETLVYSDKAQANAFEEAKRQYFAHQLVTPHHALTDARAFCAAWHRIFSANPATSADARGER